MFPWLFPQFSRWQMRAQVWRGSSQAALLRHWGGDKPPHLINQAMLPSTPRDEEGAETGKLKIKGVGSQACLALRTFPLLRIPHLLVSGDPK